MPKDRILFSSIDDIEADFLGHTSELDIDDCSYQQIMLEVWSVFQIGKGCFSSLVGMQFRHMKAQSMQLI